MGWLSRMRRGGMAAVTGAVIMLAVSGALVGPAPASAQVVDDGEAVLIVPQHRRVVVGRPGPAAVRVTGVEAEVNVHEQVAATTIVVKLENPGPRPMEAKLLMPVPDGAAVRSFQLDSLGPEPNAKIVSREEARRIYDGIVSKMKDPGLLEFAGYGLIRSSVFPIPAHGTNTVRLTYEQVLPADGPRVEFVLPRSESVDPSGAVETPLTISMDIRAERPIVSVYSPSHDVVVQRLGPFRMTVKTNAGAVSPGSFRVSYMLQPRSAAGEPAASLVAYPDVEGPANSGYFMLLVGMPRERGGEVRVPKREVIVVIDRSGSMRGEKMEQARRAASQVIAGLEQGERFNIIDYSDDVQSFAPEPVVKNPMTADAAGKYLAAMKASGGTNIRDALAEALRAKPAKGTVPIVLFLTDGLPTVGERGERAIRDQIEKTNDGVRRIFTFGVGFDVNAPLLTALAKASRATSTFVQPAENVEVKVEQVFKKLQGPVLTSPKLSAWGRDGVSTRAVRDMQPTALPDVFEGDQIVVLGRYTGQDIEGGRLNLRLAGNYLGSAQEFEFSFDLKSASAKNGYVGRLWATRKIGWLIEEVRKAGADTGDPGRPALDPRTDPRTKELVDEVVALSIKWGVLTEYTAFLAVEPGRDGGGMTPGAARPMSRREAGERAADELRDRAIGGRSGEGGVSQEENLRALADGPAASPAKQAYVGKDMKKVQMQGVQRIADRTLLQRGQRWVDSDLLERADAEPEVVVEFGTEAYTQLVDDLTTQNRQGVLAMATEGQEVYLVNRGQRVLVRGPRTP